MDRTISEKPTILMLWSAIPMAVLFGGGLVASHFLPPPLPSLGASEVADSFRLNHTGIIVGQIMLALAAALYVSFTVGIGMVMLRIERGPPVFTVAQVMMGGLCAIVLFIPSIFWAVASFRVDRDPLLIQTLNDLGWIAFVWAYPGPLFQYIALGICILSDRRAAPVIPRWVGYYTLWFAVLLCAAAPVPFFKSGPFAWNGFLAFWLVVSVYSTWLVVIISTFTRAIRRANRGVENSRGHATA